MKKLLLVAAIAVFGITSLTAQVSFGVKAGLNITNIAGDDVEDTDSKIGFHVGGFAEMPISEQLSFQPELLFSTHGSKFIDGDDELKINSNYINLPLMLKYNVSDVFGIEFGPHVGFLIDSEFESGGASIDAKDYFKSIDFGINAGFSYYFSENVFAQARYTMGLADVFEESDFTGDQSVDAKNATFSVSIGYKFK